MLCGKLYTHAAFIYSTEHLCFKVFLAFLPFIAKMRNYKLAHCNFDLTLDDSLFALICSFETTVLCREIKLNVFFPFHVT